MYTMNMIGCGRLAKTLGRLFTDKQIVNILNICNSSYESGVAAAEFIGSGAACADLSKLAHADIYLIGTPDDKIETTCNAIIENTTPPQGAIFVHCSGSLSSDALLSAKSKGYAVASSHPIKSFADPLLSVKTFTGTLCALEGEERAIKILNELFTGIGATCFPIEKQNKSLYHAAGVMANNYAVGLFAEAMKCYQRSGIDENTAHKITYMLLADALSNLKNLPPEKALTGPLQRGDTATIARHLAALSLYPDLRELYCSLGKVTLAITTLSESKKAEIQILLKSSD